MLFLIFFLLAKFVLLLYFCVQSASTILPDLACTCDLGFSSNVCSLCVPGIGRQISKVFLSFFFLSDTKRIEGLIRLRKESGQAGMLIYLLGV